MSNNHRYAGKWNKTDNQWQELIDQDKVVFKPERELMYISQKILEWYYEEEMGVIIIHGQTGYGKSSYAGICCAEVYGYKESDNTHYRSFSQPDRSFFYDWDDARNHIVFTPREFVDKTNRVKYMDKMLWWDDAGYHLNALDYNDKLIRKIGKWMELGRSKFSAVVLTCSDLRQVLSKVRDIPHVSTIKVIKGGTPNRSHPNYKWMKDRRLAKIHKSWISEDLKKSGKEREYYDVFYAHLPGVYKPRNNIKSGFYGWYKPYRDSFEKQARGDINQELVNRGL